MKLFILLLLITSIATAQFKEIETTNISGNEYYLSIPPAYLQSVNPNNGIKLFIYSETDQEISISSKSGYYKKVDVTAQSLFEVNLTPGEAQSYVFNHDQETQETKVSKGQALIIKGESSFQLNATVRYYATSDGTLILPKNKLGTEYVLSPYNSRPTGENGLPNMVTVVATENNTKIDLTVGGNALTVIPVKDGPMLFPGDSNSWNLNDGDVLTLTTAGNNQTLSGSHIKANKPIQVLSGHYCADIPVGNPPCDYTISQDYPISSWGKNFLIPFVRNRTYPAILRVFAKEPNTTIYRNGVEIGVLKKELSGFENDSWWEFRVYPYLTGNGDIAHISADKPISVSFYNPGLSEDTEAGNNIQSDPFQANIVPLEKLGKNVSISTPAVSGGNSFQNNYLALFVEANEDGKLPNEATWSMITSDSTSETVPLQDKGLFTKQLDIDIDGETKSFLYSDIDLGTVGTYQIKSSGLISGMIYGSGYFDSYGFDISVGIGTKFDDIIDDFASDKMEIIGRNDSLFLDIYLLYKNSEINNLIAEHSTEPYSFTGSKNNTVIEYEQLLYHVEDASQDQDFDLSLLSDSELLFTETYQYKAPEIYTTYNSSDVGDSINISEINPEELEFTVNIDGFLPADIAEINISSSYFDINRSSNDNNQFQIELQRRDDFLPFVDSKINISFDYGLDYEIDITGTYLNSALSVVGGTTDSIWLNQIYEGELSLISECELPANTSTTITGINLIGDEALSINSNIEFPIELAPNQEQKLTFEISGNEPGDYKYSLDLENTANEDCSTSPVFELTILDPSSVEILPDNFMRITPNPAENIIELSLNDRFNGKIRIYDINGYELYSTSISGNLLSVDISKFASGSYFLELSNKESEITKQFIKK